MPDAFDTGLMRHRLTIQRRPPGLPGQGPAGDEAVAWTTVGSCYASVEPLTGRQLFNAQETKATISHRIRIRQRPNDPIAVAPLSHRLIFRGSEVFHPESVTRVGGVNAYHEILATFLHGEAP